MVVLIESSNYVQVIKSRSAIIPALLHRNNRRSRFTWNRVRRVAEGEKKKKKPTRSAFTSRVKYCAVQIKISFSKNTIIGDLLARRADDYCYRAKSSRVAPNRVQAVRTRNGRFPANRRGMREISIRANKDTRTIRSRSIKILQADRRISQ